MAAMDSGNVGVARATLESKLTDNRSDRSYILDRMRLLLLTMADGSPAAAEETANQAFALLSTQGINADKTVSASVFNESVKIWKGEPFEQALAYYYIALQKAELGEWDNARASAASSLFRLKDFGDNERGKAMSTEELARKAAAKEAQAKGSGDEYLDKGYVAAKTDFALGYLMNGLANRALGRVDEANDNFHEAASINPALDPLCRELATGGYNTVFVVDYGVGPAKVAYGPDDSLVRFQPRQGSDNRQLTAAAVGPDGRTTGTFNSPAACDVNVMAQNLMWNNLEDVRKAKSFLGNAMLIGGTAVAIGASDNDAKWVGLGVAIAGLLVKASAAADTRYCELLPRSIFLVPMTIFEPGSTVVLDIPNDPASRMVLTDLKPPPPGVPVQLRYVRLPPHPGPWAASPTIVYANDRHDSPVPGDTVPYIMGGWCVRFPSADVVDYYHRAGNLLSLTAVELENIYRQEGITFTVEDQRGRSKAHILEGGTSLVCPLAGTTGYKRLFAQPHPPYIPRSQTLKDYLASHPTGP